MPKNVCLTGFPTNCFTITFQVATMINHSPHHPLDNQNVKAFTMENSYQSL